MTAETWEDRYREKLRELIQQKGRPVQIDWHEYERYKAWGHADDPDDYVSTYGWTDFDALSHVASGGGTCEWVVPPGSVVREKTYSQFTDTFSDNENEVGVNVGGCHCVCGRYKDVYLRWDGSVGDAINLVMGVPDAGRSIQL